MRKIAGEFDELVEEDGQVDHEMRQGTTMVVAIRPWEFSTFTELRRGAGAGRPDSELHARKFVIQGNSKPDIGT
jgi:hypothetical protein